MDTWRNSCFGKMDDLPIHATSNHHLLKMDVPPDNWMIFQFTPHHPPKMDVFPKTFLQIILAAKWLVQHSSTSPKQQRRPLLSRLYKSFFSGWDPARSVD